MRARQRSVCNAGEIIVCDARAVIVRLSKLVLVCLRPNREPLCVSKQINRAREVIIRPPQRPFEGLKKSLTCDAVRPLL